MFQGKDEFEAVFREAPGRIIVGTFASLISRIQQVFNCAHRYGRKVAIAGRAIADNVAIARRLGYIDIPADTLISLEQSQHLPARQVVILATGTQGEPAAALARMATRRHWMIEIQEHDTVIMSAQIIPGNEELVHRTINRLYQRGARVVYDELAPVHVSGHASQEEQKLLIHLLHPKYLVPIHGELRHLHAHAHTAVEMGMPEENVLVVENGYILEFTPDSATIGERVPGGYVFVDGAGVGDVGPSLMREREQLARDGFVVVVVPRGAGERAPNGEPFAEPRIVTQGLVYQPQATELLEGIAMRAQEILEEHPAMEDADLEEALRHSLEDYIYSETKRRPVVAAVLSPVYLT